MTELTLTVAGVLFDLDGVLIDSTAVVERLYLELAHRHGLEPATVMDNLHGQRMSDLLDRFLPNCTPQQRAAEESRLEEAEAEQTAGLTVLPGAREALEALDGSPWTVVTSGTPPVALARLRVTRLPAPATLVSANDVRQGKPHAEPYLVGASRIGVDPRRCLVVEDAPAGLLAGRAAGAHTVGLTTTHPLEALGTADHVVSSLACVRFARTPGGIAVHLALA